MNEARTIGEIQAAIYASEAEIKQRLDRIEADIALVHSSVMSVAAAVAICMGDEAKSAELQTLAGKIIEEQERKSPANS